MSFKRSAKRYSDSLLMLPGGLSLAPSRLKRRADLTDSHPLAILGISIAWR
jgi:hypothetical protein